MFLIDYIPLKDVWQGHWGQIASHIIGNTLVAMFFLSIGLSILIYLKFSQNRLVSQLIAWCFILCAFSRFLLMMCVWYDLYFINAIVTNMTGLLAMVSTLFVVRAILRLSELKELSELQKDLERVEKKADALKDIKKENDPTSANDMV